GADYSHQHRRPDIGCGHHHGLRRRVPGVSGQTLRRLGPRRPRRPRPPRCARDPRRHQSPRHPAHCGPDRRAESHELTMPDTTPNLPAATTTELPVILICAGPCGLAAAAHLLERGLTPVVVEAGNQIAASIRAWGHTRLFSPWQYNIDDAARRLLERTSWVAPDPTALPTGHELIDDYLIPLATALGDRVRTGVRVVAVSRDGIDKTRSAHRDETPLLVRIRTAEGTEADLTAQAVLDASGTWDQPNPLGRSGLPAPGETTAVVQGQITAPLPDVL